MSEEQYLNDPEIIKNFVVESQEHLENAEPILIELEDDPENNELINNLFRIIHSIKGSAGFLKLNDISEISHSAENLLDDVRKGKAKITTNMIDVIFRVVDVLKDMIEIVPDKIEAKGGYKENREKKTEIIDLIQKVAEGESISETKIAQLKISPEIFAQFVTEAREHLGYIEPNLLELEKDMGNLELVDEIFRSLHSIKGTSDYVGISSVTELSHKMESLFELVRNKKLKFNQEIISVTFEAFDILKELINRIAEKGNIDFDIDNTLDELDKIIKKYLYGEETEEEEEEEEDSISIFIDAAEQHLSSIEHCINKILKGETDENTQETLKRSAKSLATSASYLDLDYIDKEASAILDTLQFIKEGKMTFDEIVLEIFQEKQEKLKKLINKTKEESKAPEIAKPKPSRLGEMLVSTGKISKSDLENALKKQKLLGEILVDEGKVKKEDISNALEEQEKTAREKSQQETKIFKTQKTMRVDQSRIDRFMNLVGELIIARTAFLPIISEISGIEHLKEITNKIKESTFTLNRISDELQENVMDLRMVPVKTVFQRFPRMVRDISRKKNKLVDLKIYGEETELDKSVVEVLGDPLVHIIRNCVDHGIETPEERKSKGKNETGTVILRAGQEGNAIFIEIIDDGQGINPEKMKNKALEKGLITEEKAETMSDDEAINLVFLPGFSTAKQISDVSGRGVGMDVVKSNISKLNGTVDIKSRVGEGTTMRIELPLTLAVVEALLVETSGQKFAVPIDNVTETVQIKKSEINYLRGKKAISLREETLGLVDLKDIMQLPKNEETSNKDEISIVIVKALNKQVGFIVDELHQQQDIVIKPLESYLASIPGLGGATILGDGSVILILEPVHLISLATKMQTEEI